MNTLFSFAQSKRKKRRKWTTKNSILKCSKSKENQKKSCRESLFIRARFNLIKENNKNNLVYTSSCCFYFILFYTLLSYLYIIPLESHYAYNNLVYLPWFGLNTLFLLNIFLFLQLKKEERSGHSIFF